MLWPRALTFLFVLLAGLTFCQSADAQRSWPQDTSGIPAPPCTSYDPVGNIVSFCPAVGGAPPPGGASANNIAFGGGFFTGGDTQSGLVGSGTMDCLFVDETNVTCIGGRNVGAFNLFRSSDGGTTIKFVQTSTAGAQNSFQKLAKSTNGLYVAGVNDNPGSIQTSSNLSVFTRTAANGLPGGGPYNTIPYAGGNTFLLTEDLTNTVCRNTTTTGTALAGAWTCVTPPTWTGALLTGNNVGRQELAPSTGAGTASGIWVAVDKASPNANVVRSVNDGATWSGVTTLAEGTAGGGPSHSIVCLTNAPATCLIGLNGNIFRSIDAGVTWTQTATLTQIGLGKAFLDYHNNIIVQVGSTLATPAATPGCIPDCGRVSTLVWAKSTDAGVTWTPIYGGLGESAGVGSDGVNVATSPTTGRAIITTQRVNQGCPNSPGNCYIYGPTVPPSATSVIGSGNLLQKVLDHGEQIMAGPVQGGLLFNTSTTGGATTAVTTTITGIVGFRVHIYEISARCNTAAATATVLSITDAGTGIYSAGTATPQIIAATDFTKRWGAPGLTISDGGTAVITAGACTAGTTTLQVQADQF